LWCAGAGCHLLSVCLRWHIAATLKPQRYSNLQHWMIQPTPWDATQAHYQFDNMPKARVNGQEHEQQNGILHLPPGVSPPCLDLSVTSVFVRPPTIETTLSKEERLVKQLANLAKQKAAARLVGEAR
jgi:hypothetical protein